MKSHLLTLTDRGVVSIPAEIRRNWAAGVKRVLLTEVDGGVLIRPAPADPIEAGFGAFAHLASAGATSDSIRDEERRAETAREDEQWSS